LPSNRRKEGQVENLPVRGCVQEKHTRVHRKKERERERELEGVRIPEVQKTRPKLRRLRA